MLLTTGQAGLLFPEKVERSGAVRYRVDRICTPIARRSGQWSRHRGALGDEFRQRLQANKVTGEDQIVTHVQVSTAGLAVIIGV